MDNDSKKIGNKLREMCAVRDASEIIDGLIRPRSHFKIGKSGQSGDNTKARYVPSDYEHWAVVYSHAELALIDLLERKLISQYKQSHPDECDNDQEGGGPDGVSTYIYLAYD